ncbi:MULTISPECIES: FAD-binding oxidoreductase [unclassified Streptomyces]|uniref:FAD-binding oxidoreductase n=1 Tax=unclassified Streptomyces TaxID=2593676 RepID=UPI0003604B54|nr:FAD-binding oxidoreductase [Streptomyces sp. LaPpAH-202]MYW60167.1 FAD-binding protein [Streptomyces sp. SID8370]MYW86362.1 FAD-binding protein [Streptomyces sp. SID8371]
MISRQTITHPFNRGDYTVGAPSQAKWARHTPVGDGPAALQGETVTVPDGVLAELREAAAAVHVERAEVVARTRDWWAGSMIGETEGRPATPDAVVVEAADAGQVAAVLRICHAAGVPVTPSAGRSNVTGAALPVFGGVVLDVCRLDRITGFDAESNVVDVEAGMFGDLFEKQLQEEYGVTTGHWPSAFAVSTVGGWIACRGAGQLSTRYGKIEDMVVGVDVVHADGTRATYGDYARAAVGPDLRQLFVGSEGTLGVIVSARLRVHPLPAYAKAVAYGFRSFAEGLDACRAIMQRGATPAVLRLYDRLESGTHFGHPETNLLLIADEGDPALVDAGLAVASEVCAASGTELDGEAVFARWLDERMLVGKSSDGFTPGPGFVADTLEMAASWAALPVIYDEVVEAIESVPGTLAASAHQSHAYTDGACVYFSLRGDVEPAARRDWYRAVWDAANAVLLRHRAALSHHHGCGLLRGPYLAESLGAGFATFAAVKAALDPEGILNPGKLGLPSRFGTSPLS